MSVGRICERAVETVGVEESASQIANRMHQRAVGSVVVVNACYVPVGIVTDRDLVERVLAPGLSPLKTIASDVMTRDPTTVFLTCAIEEALAVMRDSRCRRLPVVDREQKLVGVVTLDDILMLLANEFKEVGRLLVEETPQGVLEGS